jgi:GTP:adenosylcobinamide-phosphate guanylyltransferase
VAANGGGSTVVVTTSTPCDEIAAAADRHGYPVFTCASGRGIAHDWNFALETATAPLVTLAHQDDIYYPDFAGETRRLFQALPDACLAFTDYDEIDDAGLTLPRGRVTMAKRVICGLSIGRREEVRSRWRRRALLAFGSAIPCPSVTLNRALIPEFRFGDRYQINLDWEAWWRLHAGARPFVRSRRALMAHRLHPEAETSRSKRDGRRREEDGEMFRRIWPWPLSAGLAALYRAGY